MDEEAIREIVTSSIATLLKEEAAIMQFDIGERTICACLAAILKRHFDEHSVHVEYNRRGIDPKAIELPDADGALTTARVYPDIIVHHPGNDDANLLVVEVKKSTNPVVDDLDIAKLQRIKHQIGYEHAVFLRLPTGENADPDDLRIVWI